MKPKRKIKRTAIALYIATGLLLLSLAGNILLTRQVVIERERLKMAVIPSLDGDYFSQQLYLTSLRKAMEGQDVVELRPEDMLTAGKPFPVLRVNAPLLGQNPDYPNGCEAASAVMLLQAFDIGITLPDFVDHCLPKKEVFEENGVRYGPDPSRYYAGDPASKSRGWGCFAPVIASAVERVVRQEGRPLEVQTGSCLNLPELAYQVPAVIWITSDYAPASEIYEWQSREDNKTYTYPRGSHTVLLVGCDADFYYINDPLKPESVVSVEREKLEESYDSLGRQSVTLLAYTPYSSQIVSP